MNLKEKLLAIQSELKAPKNQRNDFGKYNYRSCEDILEAVKPLCKLHNVLVTITDDIIQVSDRVYVKSTVIIADSENLELPSISVSSFARESIEKKGMDSAQITGAASSYSRKYALNGLFLIDDTKDADTQDNTSKHQEKKLSVDSIIQSIKKDEHPDTKKVAALEYMKVNKYTAEEIKKVMES